MHAKPGGVRLTTSRLRLPDIPAVGRSVMHAQAHRSQGVSPGWFKNFIKARTKKCTNFKWRWEYTDAQGMNGGTRK